MRARAGLLLGEKYELEVLLGKGGMGEVWRAHARDLNAPVAVKLLLDDVATPLGRARFEQEAKAAAALRSPHVVQVLGCGVDAATAIPFIVLELLEGETLRQRLARQGKLSWEETCRWVLHISRALARAHGAGIVHRDLKPENVFLLRNGDEELAKVLDFGIARQLSGPVRTSPGKVLGTVHYMSPEQLDGSSVDARADLWSLTLLAAECLTGARAVEGSTFGEVAMRVALGRLRVPSASGPVPAGFDAWFARGTRAAPAERFGSAEELARSLLALSSGAAERWPEPVPAAPAPVAATLGEAAQSETEGRGGGAGADSIEASTRLPSPATPPPRRERAWALLTGAALLVAAGWTLARRESPATPSSTVMQVSTSAARPPATVATVESASVALLPIEVAAGSEAAAALAEGVHADLLARLEGISALRVASGSVVRGYRGSTASPAQIARELGVGHVVQARLAAQGARATWHIQLHAADGGVLLERSYEQPLDEAVSLSPRLSSELASALATGVLPAERQRLSSPASVSSRAYQLYLEAQADGLSDDTMERLLTEALALDPEFVRAWLDLTSLHSNRYQWHVRRTPEELAAATSALARAQALAPDDPEVRRQAAWVYGALHHDWPRAYRALAALARELPYSGSLQYALSRVAERRGAPELALTHLRRAWELEPAADEYGWWLAYDQMQLRRYDDARQTLQRVQHSYFHGPAGRDFDLARLAFRQWGQTGPLEAWERALSSEARARPEVLALLGNMAWELGDREGYIARGASPEGPVDAQLRQLFLVIALRDRGDTSAAQQRLVSVEQALRAEVAAQPDNARTHARLALALALGGSEHPLALQHAKQALRLVPPEVDGYAAPQLRAAYACTLVWLGEREAATRELELLLGRPYPEDHSFFFPTHVEHLKVGLEWKPLRGLPAFEALLRAPKARRQL